MNYLHHIVNTWKFLVRLILSALQNPEFLILRHKCEPTCYKQIGTPATTYDRLRRWLGPKLARGLEACYNDLSQAEDHIGLKITKEEGKMSRHKKQPEMEFTTVFLEKSLLLIFQPYFLQKDLHMKKHQTTSIKPSVKHTGLVSSSAISYWAILCKL